MHKIIIYITILYCLSSNAQDNNLWKLHQAIADSLYSLGSYYDASEYYELALENADLAVIHFNYGKTLLAARNYSQAALHFKKTLVTGSKYFPQAAYFLGLSLKYQGNYEEALEEFDHIKSHYEGPKSVQFKKWSSTEIIGCKLALEHLNHPLSKDYNVQPMPRPINTTNSDFGPFEHKGILYYSSFGTDTLQSFYNPKEKISVYKTAWNTSTPFPKRVKEIAAEPDEHIANITFSPNGLQVYYSKCKRNKSLEFECKIYRRDIDPIDGTWQKEKILPSYINVPSTNNTQPTLSLLDYETEILYYTSDRPGGKGGTDIWYALIEDGIFQHPKNCGRNINTDRNEQGPFYSDKENKLYFSSQGHPGFGGFDVFSAGGSSKKFEKPTNLGPYLNSNADDIYFFKTDDHGFLTSNRDKSLTSKHQNCCDDIFYFDIRGKGSYVKGKIISSDLNLDEITLSLYNTDPIDGSETLINYQILKPNEPFEFKVNPQKDYKLRAHSRNKNQYYTGTSEFQTFQNKYEYRTELLLEQFQVNKEYELKDVRFDPDEYDIKPNFFKELNQLALFLVENKNIIVEISAHTDSEGQAEQNMKLSRRRAESIVTYLKSKGVNAKSITAKGYGSTKPKASNETATGREINRRCAFKIIGLEVK